MLPLTPTDESRLKLLNSRVPRKTVILDLEDSVYLSGVQCPLRKGIIYYNRRDAILEHGLYSSSKHEPRIVQFIENLRLTLTADSFKLVPVNHNCMLLMANYFEPLCSKPYLHISIHEICAYRVGHAYWTYHDWGHSNIHNLWPMKAATNTLGVTFGVNSKSHMDLFDVCTGAEKDYPLVKAGQLNYNRKLDGIVVLSPDRRILLNADGDNERIDAFHFSSGETNNMDFTFVTHLPIPNPNHINRKELELFNKPLLAFSPDGSKFATAARDGVVSVWDVRSKIPLKVINVPTHIDQGPIAFLEFSSGVLGREVLVFMESRVPTGDEIVHLIDATSFETEETLFLTKNERNKWVQTNSLFFDGSGRSMYAERDGILYEWDLRKNEDSEWWLEEE